MKVNVQTKSIFIYWYDNAICQIIQMTQHSSELVTLKNYFLLKIINSILYAATTNHKICNCVKIHNSATFERKSADSRQEAHRAHHSPEKQFPPYTSLSEGIITVNEKKSKNHYPPFEKRMVPYLYRFDSPFGPVILEKLNIHVYLTMPLLSPTWKRMWLII